MNLNAKQFDQGNAQACAFYASEAYHIGSPDQHATTVSDVATDTHVLIVGNGDCVMLAFRGTASIRNWITDAEFKRTVLEMDRNGRYVRVHEGFLHALNAILQPIRVALDKIAVCNRPLFITGHSLGGALALLASLALSRAGFKIAQVYTFGQPRVGNAAWCDLFHAELGDRTFRLVYQEDIVPRVPHLPAWHDLYRHVGREVFLDSFGMMDMAPSILRLLVFDIWGIWRAYKLKHYLAALDPVMDHSMNHYVEALKTN